jgi:predicted ribonuclease YlaK
VKLLIARCDEGTRIFFDGDMKQADSAIFRNKNGLRLLTSLSNSPTFSDIFAMVKLTTIERSKTANAASYLDEITGNI